MTALALLLQIASAPASATVGDTIWITRTFPVPARHTVRAVDWEPPEPIELVGRPRLSVRGTTAEMHYPVTAWRAGRHRVEVPGAEILGASGTVDSLPPQAVTLDIRSVLPEVPIDSPIAPQPRAALVSRGVVSPWPLLALWLATLALLSPLHWWWRRRGKPAPVSLRYPPAHVPVQRWAEAGERRTVATLEALRVRATMGDGALTPEARESLAALDRARFGRDDAA